MVRGALDLSKRQDEDEPYWLRDWGHSVYLHAGDWERHPPWLLGGANDLTDRELGSQAMEGRLSGCFCQNLSGLRDLPYSSHTFSSVRCLDSHLCPVSSGQSMSWFSASVKSYVGLTRWLSGLRLLVCRLCNLCSIPRTHIKGEGKNQLHSCPLSYTFMSQHAPNYVHAHTQ